MDFITVKKLQDEFGLPFVTATNIIDQHRKQAWKRYWPMTILAWIFLLASVVPDFADLHLSHQATFLLSLAAIALVSLQLYLVHRASREPILAAAHAQSANVPTADTATPKVV